MEEPRFGMQARGRRIVRNAHLRAEGAQQVESCALGGPGIARRQESDLATALGMPPECIEKRENSRATNERHDHVDMVGGRNLGDQLAPHLWLAGGVGEECGVEQRNEGLGDRLAATIRKPRQDGMQHCSRPDRGVSERRGLRNASADLGHEPASERLGTEAGHGRPAHLHADADLRKRIGSDHHAKRGVARPERNVRIRLDASDVQPTHRIPPMRVPQLARNGARGGRRPWPRRLIHAARGESGRMSRRSAPPI